MNFLIFSFSFVEVEENFPATSSSSIQIASSLNRNAYVNSILKHYWMHDKKKEES